MGWKQMYWKAKYLYHFDILEDKKSILVEPECTRRIENHMYQNVSPLVYMF
jgi:hypothetical protein